jgi:hypothetical protein
MARFTGVIDAQLARAMEHVLGSPCSDWHTFRLSTRCVPPSGLRVASLTGCVVSDAVHFDMLAGLGDDVLLMRAAVLAAVNRELSILLPLADLRRVLRPTALLQLWRSRKNAARQLGLRLWRTQSGVHAPFSSRLRRRPRWRGCVAVTSLRVKQRRT